MGQSELDSLGCDIEEGSIIWGADVKGHESGEPTGTEQLTSSLCPVWRRRGTIS